MSLKKALISTVAAAAITTSAMAATQTANGLGNYLVAPSYYAISGDNWTTDFRVVNTNTTDAIIAKVVIRAKEDSVELLDFPIYLTPGDVFVGKLAQDASGSVIFTTSDDSFMYSDGVSAVDTPVSQPLFKQDGSRDVRAGYIEVYAASQKSAAQIAIDALATDPTGLAATCPAWTVNTPLNKTCMFVDYGAESTTATNTDWAVPGLDLYATTVISAETAGSEKSMTLPMASFDIAPVATHLDSLNNITVRAKDTRPANTWGGLTGSAEFTNVLQPTLVNLEKAAVYVTHYDPDAAETKLIATAPFKNLYIDTNATSTNGNYPYWDSASCFYYSSRVRDNSENTKGAPTIDNPDFSGGDDLNLTAARFSACEERQTINVLQDNTEGYESGYTELIMYGGNKFDSNSTTQAVPFIPAALTGVKVNGTGVTNMYYPAYR